MPPSPPANSAQALSNPLELHYLCREIKQSRMAENQRPNPAFEKESIIMQHGIFALLVGTLNNQIQVKYQSIKASPFDSHDVIMSTFLLALFIYATASVAEVMLRARESPYSTLVGNLRLFASALAAVLLLSILAPILGCVISAVWACLFLGIAYESSLELYSILNQSTSKFLDMVNSVRRRNAEPDQPNV